jgi:hypothetical protein
MEFITAEDRLLFKQKLKEHCVAILKERVETARQAMESAQESANNEGKSSAGDKYETGRAMRQTDRDLSAGRMDEAILELLKLQSIEADKLYNEIKNGTVVLCSDMTYFIAAGLGVINYEGRKVIVLSPKAPLSNLLRGKMKCDTVTFNENSFEITDLF